MTACKLPVRARTVCGLTVANLGLSWEDAYACAVMARREFSFFC